MATKYLSENDLPYLEQRIAQVFAEKPIVAQFTLETTDWASDSATGKQKCSVAIDSDDFTSSSMGDVGLDLSSLSTVADRIAASDACTNAKVRMLGVSSENVSGSTVYVLNFYADSVPSVNLPMVLTIIGNMPENN